MEQLQFRTFCTSANQCVEFARTSTGVVLRDKNGSTVQFSNKEWDEAIAGGLATA